jgi:hypothetical protein
VRLSRRHHAQDGFHVSRIDVRDSAQMAFALGRFLGQDVALESVTRFHGTTWTHAKTFLRGAFGFHFWHSHLSGADSSISNRIAGGNKTLRLDACFHLFLQRRRVHYIVHFPSEKTGSADSTTVPPNPDK